MRIKLWGVRGSIATPIPHNYLREKLVLLLSEATPADIADAESIAHYLDSSPHSFTYGGNTSCVEVSLSDEVVLIFDAGTGMRDLAAQMMQDGRGTAAEIHCFFSHFHWDHICGFPFFAPIYLPDRIINIWSGRSDADELLAGQMARAYFPAKWDSLPSTRIARQIPTHEAVTVAGAEIRIVPMIHPDKAYGYRINYQGHSVCYLTDTEITKDPNRLGPLYAEFVAGADLVIVDAMYGFLEYHDHVNFGHSTIFNWIDFFRESQIGELVIFHHDPMASDQAIAGLEHAGDRYRKLNAPDVDWPVTAAREGKTWVFE